MAPIVDSSSQISEPSEATTAAKEEEIREQREAAKNICKTARGLFSRLEKLNEKVKEDARKFGRQVTDIPALKKEILEYEKKEAAVNSWAKEEEWAYEVASHELHKANLEYIKDFAETSRRVHPVQDEELERNIQSIRDLVSHNPNLLERLMSDSFVEECNTAATTQFIEALEGLEKRFDKVLAEFRGVKRHAFRDALAFIKDLYKRELLQRHGSLSSRVDEIETSANKYRSRLVAQTAEAAELQSSFKALEHSYDKEIQRLAESGKEIGVWKKSCDSLKEDLHLERADKDAALAALQSKKAELVEANAAKAQIQMRYDYLNVSHKALQTLQDKERQQRATIAESYTRTVEGLKTQLAELKLANETSEGNFNRLQISFHTLETNASAIPTGLRAQIDTLSQETETLREKSQQIGLASTETEAASTRLRKDLEDVSAAKSGLNATLLDKSGECEAKDRDLKELRAEYDSLVAKSTNQTTALEQARQDRLALATVNEQSITHWKTLAGEREVQLSECTHELAKANDLVLELQTKLETCDGERLHLSPRTESKLS